MVFSLNNIFQIDVGFVAVQVVWGFLWRKSG